MAWSDDSQLVRFSADELVAAFDAADELRAEFPVNNPSASIADMKRHLRGEREKFTCYTGYKSFYMDWNYTVWRCDAWSKPMCSVWEFGNAPFVRDGFTACIADCYRDSSVMLHFAVAPGDTADSIAHGRLLNALKTASEADECLLHGRCPAECARDVATGKSWMTLAVGNRCRLPKIA